MKKFLVLFITATNTDADDLLVVKVKAALKG